MLILPILVPKFFGLLKELVYLFQLPGFYSKYRQIYFSDKLIQRGFFLFIALIFFFQNFHDDLKPLKLIIQILDSNSVQNYLV